jgi:hypothetical protein
MPSIHLHGMSLGIMGTLSLFCTFVGLLYLVLHMNIKHTSSDISKICHHTENRPVSLITVLIIIYKFY